MLYCSQADEKSTGEPSRYIRQLDYESHFEVRKTEVGADVNLPADEPLAVSYTHLDVYKRQGVERSFQMPAVDGPCDVVPGLER